MVQEDSTIPPATCPQCGGPIVAHLVPEEREIVRVMKAQGASVPYAAHYAAEATGKERRSGVVYTCVSCRYSLRIGGTAHKETEAAV